ncbi:MAG: hypothetical protein J1E41_03345 [Ruminococcus sp.]|nr:hypothetical protein [Ruminococcus sp.]
MIIIKRNGKFNIPAGDAFVGCDKENSPVVKEFFVEDVIDLSLIFRMTLLFDDGTSRFFILESEVTDGGTRLKWNATREQIYKDGIVKMQIKASNPSGLVFHSEQANLVVRTSVELENVVNG